MPTPTGEELERVLASGHERPAILVLRAHRLSAMLALVLFAAWLIVAYAWDAGAAYKDAVLRAFAIVLLASLVLKLTGRWLDRRAMRLDMALLEEGRR